MTPLSLTALEAAAKAAQAKRAELQHAPLARIYSELATAAITAYLAQAEKEGWVVVPKVATQEMIDAVHDASLDIYWSYVGDERPGGPEDAYRVMIAVAQHGGE